MHDETNRLTSGYFNFIKLNRAAEGIFLRRRAGTLSADICGLSCKFSEKRQVFADILLVVLTECLIRLHMYLTYP